MTCPCAASLKKLFSIQPFKQQLGVKFFGFIAVSSKFQQKPVRDFNLFTPAELVSIKR